MAGREVALIETLLGVAGASFLAGVVFAWFLKFWFLRKQTHVPPFALHLEYIVYCDAPPCENALLQSKSSNQCEWLSPATHPTYFNPPLLFGRNQNPLPCLTDLKEAVSACRISSVARLEAPTWEPLQSAIRTILQLCQCQPVLAVWDRESEKFYSSEEWLRAFGTAKDPPSFEEHVQTEWEDQIYMGKAYTKGMAKAGFPEIELRNVPLDHQTLALFLVTSAASEIWARRTIAPIEVEGFGECFRIEFTERRWHEHKRGVLSTQIRTSRKITNTSPL